MSKFDDDYRDYDDDDELDDELDEDELDDDDDSVGSRSSVNPFGSGQPRSPAPSSGGLTPRPSGLTSSPRPNLPGSPPSGGSFGGSRPNLPGSPPGGSRPNLPGSPPSGGSFGGSRPNLPGSPPSGGSFGGSRPNLPGSPPSSLSGNRPSPPPFSPRPSDPSKPASDKPRSGGFGGLGSFGKRDDSKKDDKSSGGGLLGGLGSRIPGGGGGDKKAPPKSDRPAGGNPLGSFGSKLPFGKKDEGAKKENKPAGGGGNLLGGLGSRLPGGDRRDASARPGGSSPTSSSFGSSSSGAGKPPFGGGTFGGGGSSAGGRPAQPKAAKAEGNVFSRLFGGGKKADKPARAKTSKAPKVQQDGLSLDTKLDIIGVALTVVSLALLLSSLSPTQGAITGEINNFLSYLFGWGALAAPIGMLGAGIWLILRHFGDDAPTLELQRVIGLIVLYLTILTVMQFFEAYDYPPNALQTGLLPQFIELSSQLGRGGGYVGGQVYTLLVSNAGEIGGFILLLIPLIVGLMLTLSLGAAEIVAIVISNARNMGDSARQRSIRAAAERARRDEERALAQQRAQLASGQVPAEALPSGERPALPMPSESPIPMQLPLSGSQEQRTIPIMQGGRTFTASVSDEETTVQPAQPLPVAASVAPPAAPERHEERSRSAGLGRLIPSALAGGAAAAVKALTPTEEEDTPAEKPAAERRGFGIGGLGNRLPFGKKDETATAAAAPAEAAPANKVNSPPEAVRPPGIPRPSDTGTPDAPMPVQTPAPQVAAQNASAPAASVSQETAPSEDAAPRFRDLLRPQPSAAARAPSPAFGKPTTPITPAASAPTAPTQKPEEKAKEDDWAALPPAQPKGPTGIPARPEGQSPFAPRVMQPRDNGETKSETPTGSSAPTSWQDRMAALRNKLPGETTEDEEKAETNGTPGRTDLRPRPFSSVSSPFNRDQRTPPRIVHVDDDGEEIDEDDLNDDIDLDEDLPLDELDKDDLPAASMKPVTPTSTPRPQPFSPPPRTPSPAFGRPETPAATTRLTSPPPTPAPTPAPPAQAPAASAMPVSAPQPEPTPAPSIRINPPDPAPPARPTVAASADEPPPPPQRGRKDWRQPDPATLLATGMDQELDHALLLQRAKTIEETLQSFGAPGRVVEVRTGPVITQFGVEPDYLTVRGGKKVRVKVGAIAQLDKDLQLALGAKSIRIEAPVPGKGYVGIEVPNDQAAIVRLRDVLESEQFKRIKSPLGIALGQGVDGTPVAADLGSMPHLLIAGTTGSGKSVCVNSIIASLLLSNMPDRMKFIMVDPKRVELTAYNGIPHLLAPVVVELERIVGVLKWVTREMDERYRKFSSAGARNIEDYNKHLMAGEPMMPYIVVIIDELADLMMLAPEETERVITRLAALARATGIHLVIATQRPSVDVVTGLIKANFPARIAFAVAGSVDSRVILDQPGAERLLGRGDMLYMSGDSPAPVRLQGVFVSDTEINNITRYWRQQMDDSELAAQSRPLLSNFALDEMTAREASGGRGNGGGLGIGMSGGNQPRQQAFWDRDSGPSSFVSSRASDDSDDDNDEDDLYEQAVALVRTLKKASVSLLQRRLRIGYTRAAKLIDLMEERGVVGPAQSGSTPREVIG